MYPELPVQPWSVEFISDTRVLCGTRVNQLVENETDLKRSRTKSVFTTEDLGSHVEKVINYDDENDSKKKTQLKPTVTG